MTLVISLFTCVSVSLSLHVWDFSSRSQGKGQPVVTLSNVPPGFLVVVEFPSLTVLLRGRGKPTDVAATSKEEKKQLSGGAPYPSSNAALHPSLALMCGPFHTSNPLQGDSFLLLCLTSSY